MNEIVNQSLQKMAKGTTIIFFGTILGLLLAFFGRIIIIRHITTTEFGLLSLGLMVLNISSMVSMVGLSEGITRQVAYFRGKNENRKVWSVIFSSFKIVIIAIIISFLSVYLFSDFISVTLFHNKELSSIIKTLAFAIPFTVLINIIVSIFRGFGIVSVKVYFNDFLKNILLLIFFSGVAYFSLSLTEIVYVYLLVPVIVTIVLLIYGIKKIPMIIDLESGVQSMKKDMLFFSLPLFGLGILNIITTSTDTLMLGYFKTLDVVGLYNAALPIANLIPVVLTSLGFIYIPVVSQMHSRNQVNEIKRTYAIMTKWVFSTTLPIFMLMFLFPDSVLNILFGAEYTQASVVLRLIAIGFFSHIFLGPNGMTLLVMGNTKLIFVNSIIKTVINIILNFLLIPPLGLTGAAVASASSLVLGNSLASTELFLIHKIHPFTRNYLKSIMGTCTIFFVFWMIIDNLPIILSIQTIILFFILFIITYVLAMMLTKSFDVEDSMLALSIGKRVGINLESIKQFKKV